MTEQSRKNWNDFIRYVLLPLLAYPWYVAGKCADAVGRWIRKDYR